MSTFEGNLQKMVATAEPTTGGPLQVFFQLAVGEERIDLNRRIGQSLSLTYRGTINCVACGRETRKSFNQGYCFPCVQRLAECDICIVRPEKCHYAAGTCREPAWGEVHCMQGHYVYLSNTSGLKVGITRGTQIPTRWIDQGATQALPIFRTANRHLAGLVEVALKEHVADRTDWRKMLKGEAEPLDLAAERATLVALAAEALEGIWGGFGEESVMAVEVPQVELRFPVESYPAKVKALNFDKDPVVAGTLLGIKGQYLIFDTGVINIRKYGGYLVEAAV